MLNHHWFRRHEGLVIPVFLILSLMIAAELHYHFVGSFLYGMTDRGWNAAQAIATVLATSFTAWAAWAASRAASTAGRTIEQMRDTARRELRAYVNLESAQVVFRPDPTLGGEATLDIVLRNFGQTPAHHLSVAITVPVGERRISTDPHIHGSIGPTAPVKVRRPLFDYDPRQVTDDDLSVVVLWAEIAVTYRTEFCGEHDLLKTTDLVLVRGDHFKNEDGSLMGFHLIPSGPGNRST